MARPDSSKIRYGRILDRARILYHPTMNLYSWASCLVVSEARFAPLREVCHVVDYGKYSLSHLGLSEWLKSDISLMNPAS